MSTVHSLPLRKLLGTFFGIAVTVGAVIGSGILYNPGTIASLLKNEWLILLCWLLGGLYMLVATRSDAELATMMPKAGGPYNYAQTAFGSYAGFLTGWFDFLVNSLAPAYVSIAIAEYIVRLSPAFAGNERIIAIGIILLLTAYHMQSVQNGVWLQRVTSFSKLILFALLIAACFYAAGENNLLFQSNSDNMASPDANAFFQTMQLIIGTYGGWNAACYFAEEFDNPGRQLPKALLVSGIIVIVVFMLINMAIFSVLPVNAIAGSSLAAADAARLVFGKAGEKLFIVLAVVSLISILNAMIMVPSRILFGLGRSGYFFKSVAKVNKNGSPWSSILFIGLLEIIFILTGTFNDLFALGAFAVLAVNLFTYSAVPVLRKKFPNTNRPYRQWGYPATSIIILIVMAILLCGFAMADFKSLAILLAIALLALPLHWGLAKMKYISNDDTQL